MTLLEHSFRLLINCQIEAGTQYEFENDLASQAQSHLELTHPSTKHLPLGDLICRHYCYFKYRGRDDMELGDPYTKSTSAKRKTFLLKEDLPKTTSYQKHYHKITTRY